MSYADKHPEDPCGHGDRMEEIDVEASTLGLHGWPNLLQYQGEEFRRIHTVRDDEGDILLVHYMSRTRKLVVFND